MRLTCIAILLFLCHSVIAQQQNNNWCFGKGVRISFSAATPAVSTSASHAFEGGSATVSDPITGALLFYTDGVSVWNAKHVKMPNGSGIGTDVSLTSAQGSVIVPMPGDSSKYYIFTHEEETSVNGAVFFSIVDMDLDGGWGDVIPGKKMVLLDEGFAEGMTATTSCGGHWLILLRRNTSIMAAYKIDASGINRKPVLSSTGYAGQKVTGFKVSPDTKHLLLALYGGTDSISSFAYCDFSKAAGRVTKVRTIDTIAGTDFYSCAFSHGGRMGYVCAYAEMKVYQYDLTLASSKAIRASRQLVCALQDQPGDLQLGPDSNIYIAMLYQPSLSRISNADSTNFVFTPRAVNLPYQGQVSTLSLPQAVLYPPFEDDSVAYKTQRTDIYLCSDKELLLQASPGFTSYYWQDKSQNDHITVDSDGVYWVLANKGCVVVSDTFFVTKKDIRFSLGDDTAICKGEVVRLSAPSFPGTVSYLWQNNATAATIDVMETGKYYITIRAGNCTESDTISVSVYDAPHFDLGRDTIACYNDQGLELDATSWDNCTYTWSVPGDGATYLATSAGVYWATAENICGAYSDTIRVDFQNCDCKPFVPSFTPNNDGLNDGVKPLFNCIVTEYDFFIFNRWGQAVFRSQDPEEKWDGTYRGKPAEMDTYFYQLKVRNVKGDNFLYKGDLLLLR